jgi:glycosyltransferase involved in cell wall biosynthesis
VRILALSTAIPFPPTSGGKLRTYHLLRALARRNEVTLAGFTYGEEPAIAPFPARIFSVPWTAPPLYQQMTQGDTSSSQAAADQLSNELHEPWCVNWADSAEFEALIQYLSRDRFDLVLLEGTPMARFLPVLPPDVPRILDFMDVYSRMAQRQLDVTNDVDHAAAEQELARTIRFERAAAAQCDACLAVSAQESLAATNMLGAERVEVVPNGVDTNYFRPSSDETKHATLLFTGAMSYRPNSEAVVGFVREILPLVLQDLPKAILHVVGSAPPREVTSLESRNVTVHGFVADMRPYHRRSSVVVVPLLRGGGTKLKVLEAAAMGKAIVTTSIGVEGLPFRDSEELIVADSPETFARAVVRLVRDDGKRRKLGERARDIALGFDWEIIGDRLCRIVEAVGRRNPAVVAAATGES